MVSSLSIACTRQVDEAVSRTSPYSGGSLDVERRLSGYRRSDFRDPNDDARTVGCYLEAINTMSTASFIFFGRVAESSAADPRIG